MKKTRSGDNVARNDTLITQITLLDEPVDLEDKKEDYDSAILLVLVGERAHGDSLLPFHDLALCILLLERRDGGEGDGGRRRGRCYTATSLSHLH